jgi:hypothetical protein
MQLFFAKDNSITVMETKLMQFKQQSMTSILFGTYHQSVDLQWYGPNHLMENRPCLVMAKVTLMFKGIVDC